MFVIRTEVEPVHNMFQISFLPSSFIISCHQSQINRQNFHISVIFVISQHFLFNLRYVHSKNTIYKIWISYKPQIWSIYCKNARKSDCIQKKKRWNQIEIIQFSWFSLIKMNFRSPKLGLITIPPCFDESFLLLSRSNWICFNRNQK